MRNTIAIYSNPETKKTEIDFPTPLNGIPKIEERIDEDKKYYVIPFSKMNQEQKAYWAFWENGTEKRINTIISNDSGAGVRKVLKWLIGLRIREAFEKTGFVYQLVIISDSGKWKKFQESKKDGHSIEQKS